MRKYIIFFIILVVIFLFIFFQVDASTKTSGIENFPKNYQPYLNLLKQKHPNWNFVALYTNLDWNNVIAEENIFGRSLVPKNYSDNWKNTKSGQYNVEVDSGWVDASKNAVEFCMDPRNFLNEARIFQFEELSYNSHTNSLEGIEKILYGTEFYNQKVSYFDYNGNNISTNQKYSDLILNAGKSSLVSSYHLASRIKQEVGPFLSHSSISGTVEGFKGLYNFYNIGATSSSEPMGAIKNGLMYAKDGKGASQEIKNKYLIPWNTKERAITGGAIFIGSSYINVGQNTIYLQKFDVADEGNNGLYWHQYMTNILAPYSEAKSIYNGYQKNGLLDTSMTFVIPVFENMSNIPTQNPNINENDFQEDNTEVYCNAQNVNIRTGPSTSYDIITSVSNPYKMKRIGKGIQSGDKWDRVLIEDSIIGYIYQNYLSETPLNININFNSPLIEDNNEITGLDYNKNTVLDIKPNVITDLDYDIINNKGKILSDTDLIGTGTKIRLKQNGKVFAEYSFILYGDANGDGSIDSIDLLVLQRHILEIEIMQKIYQTAVTLVPNEQDPTSIDMLKIQRHILGLQEIEIPVRQIKNKKMDLKKSIALIDTNIDDIKNNTNLETLAIENELLYPAFDNNVTSYSIEVSNNITSVNLLAIPENENAKIQIDGGSEINEGDNLIQITVISENNKARKTFKINVHRRTLDEENNYNNNQIENQEKLNKIYSSGIKFQPINVEGNYTAEKTSFEVKKTNSKQNSLFVGIVIIIILVIFFIFLFKKIKQK